MRRTFFGDPGSGSSPVAGISRQVQLLADTPIDPSPPTVTIQTSAALLANATSTVTGTLIKPGDAGDGARYNAFRLESRSWSGSPMYGPRPPHRGDNAELTGTGNSVWTMDFGYDEDTLEIPFIVGSTFRLIVDGKYAQAAPYTATGTTGYFAYAKIAFGSVKFRNIRLEMGVHATTGFPGGYFSGIKTKNGRPLFPPTIPTTERMALVWDSFGTGGGATLTDLRGAAAQLARILGITDYVSLCRAGSGFTLGASGNEKYAWRIDDLVAAEPDYTIILGSANDYANRATTLAAESLAFYQACKAQLPDTNLLATGALHMTAANSDAITAVIKTQAETAGVTFLDTTGWTASLPATYIDTDGYHPTIAGHEWIARRLAPLVADAWDIPLL